MKAKRIYRLILENESRLEQVKNWRLTRLRLALILTGLFFISIIFAGTIICLTPIHNLLPGYMKATEREATMENMLKLDSLAQAMDRNEEYLRNLRTVLDTDRTPSDSINATRPANSLTSDSLLPTSREEERFVSAMQERERYNISIIAPLASEGMIFYPVSEESIFVAETRNSLTPRISLAEGSAVECLADGVVIAVYASEKNGGGHTIVIQHGKGFLSSYSRMAMPTVSAGEKVEGGQTISLQTNGQGMRSSEIILRMWHNGTPLKPYDYIGPSRRPVRDGSTYEAPRGRI